MACGGRVDCVELSDGGGQCFVVQLGVAIHCEIAVVVGRFGSGNTEVHVETHDAAAAVQADRVGALVEKVELAADHTICCVLLLLLLLLLS